MKTANERRRPPYRRTDVPDCVDVLGTRIQCLRTDDVLRQLLSMLDHERAYSVYIVNAATLNLAYENPLYRAVLNRGDFVLNDGTGVRWAARVQGVRLADNNVGTDLVPRLLERSADRGLRLYLLGGHPETTERAGKHLMDRFPGVEVVGMQHGYFLPSEEDAICADVVARAPDVALVGMGNPLQELWIDRHLAHFKHGVVIGVGGSSTISQPICGGRRCGCARPVLSGLKFFGNNLISGGVISLAIRCFSIAFTSDILGRVGHELHWRPSALVCEESGSSGYGGRDVGNWDVEVAAVVGRRGAGAGAHVPSVPDCALRSL